MLVVGVDCWALRKNGGGARYVFESIIRYMDSDEDLKFILFLHPEAYECIHELEIESGLLRQCIKIRIDCPTEIFKYEHYYNIMYAPFNNNSHRYYTKPVVSLIHDVQERFLPELFSAQDLEARIEIYDDIVKSSDKTITISEFCKSSLIEHCSANPTAVEVVYNAPQEQLLAYISDETLINSNQYLGLTSNSFIFYPANFYAHKNHERLLAAYKMACNERDMPKLVLMGMTYGGDDSIYQDIKRFALDAQVLIVSRLTPRDVAWLYMHCVYVVLPTLFEGFCMPAVEATAFGKNLACSDLDILKEVTGNTGLYFDPLSSVDMKEKLISLLNSDIKQSSLGNLPTYSWPKSAQETKNIFRNVFDEYSSVSVQKLSLMKMSIFIDMDNGVFERFTDTINSILNQKIKPEMLEIICISNNIERLSTLPDSIKRSLKSEVNPIANGFYYLISAGNQLMANFFQNIAIQEEDDNKWLMFEVEQSHEDKAMSFESNVYLRIFEEHSYLKGDLYPELFLFKDITLLKKVINTPSNLYEYFVSYDFSLKRKTLAKVMFCSSVAYRRNIKKTKALRFEPEMNYDLANVNINQVTLNHHFVEHVDTVISADLGCVSPNKVTEASKLFKLIEGV